VHLGYYLIIIKGIEVSRCRVWAIWCLIQTFPIKLLPDLICGIGCVEASTVMEKDDFLCEQARMFSLDGFLQVPQFLQK
jgi:hypothetical protein